MATRRSRRLARRRDPSPDADPDDDVDMHPPAASSSSSKKRPAPSTSPPSSASSSTASSKRPRRHAAKAAGELISDAVQQLEADDKVLVSVTGRKKRKAGEDDEDFEEDDDDDAGDAGCLCGGVDDEMMVGCDACGRWLHLSCVGLDEDSPELEAPTYHCPQCAQAAKASKPKRRKTKKKSTKAADEDGDELAALRKKLKAIKVAELRPLLREYGEMQAATGKKGEVIDKLVALRHTLPAPEAMKLVMGSSHLASIILQFVAAGDLFQCAFVSRVWRKAACHPLQWQKFLQNTARPPITINFPAGTSLVDRSKALAQAYFNLFEPGYMCSECKVVPFSREKMISDVGWLQANVRVVTSTHMFGVARCYSCKGSMNGGDTYSEYRVRATESTLPCTRHYNRYCMYYRYRRSDVLRLACTTYGGQSNLNAFLDYRTRGGSSYRPMVDYMVHAKEKTARWKFSRMPELMPVTAEDARQVLASAGRTHLIGVVDKLIAGGHIPPERHAAARQLAVEHGHLACLHEGCAETFHLSDSDYFSGGEPNCKHLLCIDHCTGTCSFHTKRRAEIKRRAACAQAEAAMAEFLAKVIARDDVSQQRASLFAVPDLYESRHSLPTIEKVKSNGRNCFKCLKGMRSDRCVYCAQCCKGDSRVDTVEQGCKLHHEAELDALAAFSATVGDSTPHLPSTVYQLVRSADLLNEVSDFVAAPDTYCTKCVSGKGRRAYRVPLFRKLPEESLGKCDHCASCCTSAQRWDRRPKCATHPVSVPVSSAPKHRKLQCAGPSCSNTPSPTCTFGMCGPCCYRNPKRNDCVRHSS